MIKKKVKCRAYGKVNLSLNITGVVGGMHELDMVLSSVDIADEITVCERFDDSVNVEFSCGGIDKKNNTVTKTIGAIAREVGHFGCDIFIQKKVPLCGGMGSSSVDCAGVITAVNELFGFKFGQDVLNRIALASGSDVPYMLNGGFARVKGIGDKIEYFKSSAKLYMVIAQKKGSAVISGECYKQFDKLYPSLRYCPTDNDKLISAIESDDKAMYSHFDNALLTSSIVLCQDIGSVINLIKSTAPIVATMTGSGSVCVGYYRDKESALKAEAILRNHGLFAEMVMNNNCGVELI